MDKEKGDLDGALRAGFGGLRRPSVLESIERKTGRKSRVLLHDEPGDVAPLIRVRPREETQEDSRYQVIGEIATGGVGVVHKARDKDLGRDVALKVLRADHADRPDVIERFVEEAQIGAQLQHPGIVPVYGIGVQSDGLPYFTMKLIKGRTLAALLKERNDVGTDRRKFLRVFEQVCQTIAYCHTRGVIHRDLKPSNIMVGNFGEVQVVDWGFGKVLGRREPAQVPEEERTVIATVRSASEGSESITGSVMGTPAYMCPEQALGHVEDLDERADVFSLGAILCEILTGKPPYNGPRRDLLVQAAQGKLEDAFARLSSAVAEPVLTRLATHCLAPMSSERPENAGIVAETLGKHFAESEERARQAEIDAIDQRAAAERAQQRAVSANRRKRKTLAAAALMLLVAGIAMSGWTVHQSDLRKREEALRGNIDTALRSARFLAGKGEWQEAVAQAEHARSLATNTKPDLRAETDSRVAKLKQERDVAVKKQVRVAEEQTLAMELASLALARAAAPGGIVPSRRSLVARGMEALAALGLEQLRPQDFKARLAESTFRLKIAFGLDYLTYQLSLIGDARVADTVACANAIDTDALRSEIRATAKIREFEELLRISKLPELDEQPREALVFLCRLLFRRYPQQSATLIGRSVRLCPDDPQLRQLRHDSFMYAGNSEQSLSDASAMVALLPDSLIAWIALADALQAWDGADDALSAHRRAADLAPTHAFALSGLCFLLAQHPRDRPEMVRRLQRAINLDPTASYANARFARHLLETGKSVAGVERLHAAEQMAKLDPETETAFLVWLELMFGWRLADRPNRAMHAALRALEVAELPSAKFRALSWLSKLESERGNAERALELKKEAVAVSKGRSFEYRGLSLLADGLRLRGNFESARTLARKSIKLSKNRLFLDPYIVLVRIETRHGKDFRAASKTLDDVPEPLRDSAEFIMVRGNLHSAMGDRERAIEVLEDGLKIHPRHPEITVALGATHLDSYPEEPRSGHATSALKIFRGVRAGGHMGSVQRYATVIAHVQRCDWPAVEAAARANLRKGGVSRRWTRFQLCRSIMFQGRLKEAEKELQKLRRSDRTTRPFTPSATEHYLSILEYARGNFKAAQEVLAGWQTPPMPWIARVRSAVELESGQRAFPEELSDSTHPDWDLDFLTGKERWDKAERWVTLLIRASGSKTNTIVLGEAAAIAVARKDFETALLRCRAFLNACADQRLLELLAGDLSSTTFDACRDIDSLPPEVRDGWREFWIDYAVALKELRDER